MKKKRNCRKCDRVFVVSKSNRFYCSKECSDHRKKMNSYSEFEDRVVYIHRKPCGTPFYVGIGSIHRSKETRDRNILWQQMYKEYPNYIVDIVARNTNGEAAKEAEKALISFYGRINNGTGVLCNMTDGGEGCSGLKHEDKLRPVIRLDKSGQIVSEYDSAVHAQEDGFDYQLVAGCCNKRHMTHKGFQFYFKDEYLSLLESDFDFTVKGNYSHSAVRVVQLTEDGGFVKRHPSMNVDDFCDANISAVCRGKERIHRGFAWMYEDEYDALCDENGKVFVRKSNSGSNRISIVQLDKKTLSLINTYKSAYKAEEELGISHSHIGGCCKGDRLSAGGFRWQYLEDYKLGRKIRTVAKSAKPVIQLTLDGEFVAKHDSASCLDWVRQGDISAVCRGIRNSAKGFKWVYEEDYKKKHTYYYIIS